MADFNNALEKVLQNEGGYSNDPHDPGRETYAGISRRFWPHWDGWKTIDKYKPLGNNQMIHETAEDVAEFYFNTFWLPLKCDKIANESIAESLFDFAVNVGRKRAIRVLQDTVNIYSGKKRIKVDGIMGEKTLAGIEAACRRSLKFPNGFIRFRIDFYFDLCYNSPKKYRYLRGWIIRSLKSLEKHST